MAIIGSGSLTHNLLEFRDGMADEAAYTAEFRDWVRDAVVRRDVAELVDYRRLAPHARRAHPTQEHFLLPLLVALGASFDEESVHVIDAGTTHGVLSMESYAWGLLQSGVVPDFDRMQSAA